MTEESPSQNPSTATGDEAPQPGKATKVGATAVLALIAASLLWYFAADRLTPHTTQARVQAFVCLLYTSPSPRDGLLSRMPSSA